MGKENGNDRRYYGLAFKMFADFSGVIAVPAVAAAIFGKWLDERYNTYPRYIVILLAFAFLSTVILIRKKTLRYKTEYLKIIETDDKKKSI